MSLNHLFVYGGLLSAKIRKYKKVNIQGARNALLKGYQVTYNRKVSNCKHSLYHVPDQPEETNFGMLNLYECPSSKTWGKVLFLTDNQMKKVLLMEPGYKLIQVQVHLTNGSIMNVQTLKTEAMELLDHTVEPNPIYQDLVQKEIQKIKNNF